ncbi:flagellin N-terminal helical domain-containing protein [Clostridium estertheticum]|uniref:Flagellin n=1 Tax=Clostridium estertheticum subsp. estertheticum TaxID=1552 RepID=A0A1J0GIJ0_9CLOT|nr:flagellin [Clostridium estertheticum]APC41157.1 flagellin [Clostridium estertheticum subsp. estertheticum]MBU3074165.1 flagellin [Clostridium estertheticum]MBU3164259.1 flagellin [Clostridium estertheticum]
MRINKNLASINIYREYSKNLIKQGSSLERVSSGIKINNSKEDPNAMAQSERFRMQIRGLQMAGNNAQDGVSMLQTAEGSLDGITSMLQRVRELVVQAGGTTTDLDKEVIQKEITQMLSGVDDMANNNEFNGVKLLNVGDATGATGVATGAIGMVTGVISGEKIVIPTYNLTASGLKLRDGTTDKVDVVNVDTAVCLGLVDTALDAIMGARSKFGALENRFQSSSDSTTEISDKIQSAESGIRDTDLATELMEYSKYNLLVEAGTAMMVQSNQLPQNALKILENVRSR